MKETFLNSSAKLPVLFLCIHNSARSVMAEAWLRHICGGCFDVYSAGFEPGVLNPLAVEVMREIGIDISQHVPKSVFALFNQGRLFRFVITVCDAGSAERCPIFPGFAERLHWGFPDPGKAAGTNEEKLTQVRDIRDAIREKIEQWCGEVCVDESRNSCH